jgi:hypothetical protein
MNAGGGVRCLVGSAAGYACSVAKGASSAGLVDGRGGVTSDWLCMWREGRALDPTINIVASLCADVRFFGSALRMGGLAAGFLFLLGADCWSGALVRPGFAGPWRLVLSQMTLSHNYVGVVGGALASWGPIVQLARSALCSHLSHNYMGSWEVHSVVGLVSAGEDTLWGVLGPVGGRAVVLFWDVSGTNGVVGTYAWWQCCVFRCWIGHEHILLGSTLTPGACSPLTVIFDSKFPYWCMLVPGVACLNSNPRQNPRGCWMLCICCTR